MHRFVSFKTLFTFAILFIQFLSHSCSPQQQTPPLSSDQFITSIDEQVPAWLDEFIVHGMALAFVEKGEVVYKKGYGYADVKQGLKVTSQTGFNVASISKNITAWAVMKLVEEGKLQLDDPAEKYLTRWHFPSSVYNTNQVTIRRLLSHTAGVSVHGFPGYYSPKDLPSLLEVLKGQSNTHESVELIQKPGSKYQYSGGGYTVLQLLVEEVSGLSFQDYVQQAVLTPLNMNKSSFKIDEEILKNSSLAYNEFGEEIPLVRFTAQAAAGFHTTLDDLCAIALASLGGTPYGSKQSVLSPSSISLMTRLAENSKKSGLGYQINNIQPGKLTLVGYEGNNDGWNAYYRVNRQTGDGFVVLTNGGSHRNIYHQILSQWVDWKLQKDLNFNNEKTLNTVLIHAYQKQGIEKMIELYFQLKAANFPNLFPENSYEYFFNVFGYHLLAKGKTAEAILVFHLNTKEYPGSWNCFDSLGEAYEKNGEVKKAITNYHISIALNKQNENQNNTRLKKHLKTLVK